MILQLQCFPSGDYSVFCSVIIMYIRNSKSYWISIKFECVWVSTGADWNLGWISWVAIQLIIRNLPENKEESYLHLEHWKVSLGEISRVHLFVSTCTVAVLMRYLRKPTLVFLETIITTLNLKQQIVSNLSTEADGDRSKKFCVSGNICGPCELRLQQPFCLACVNTYPVQWNVGVCFTESLHDTLKNVKRNFLP